MVVHLDGGRGGGLSPAARLLLVEDEPGLGSHGRRVGAEVVLEEVGAGLLVALHGRVRPGDEHLVQLRTVRLQHIALISDLPEHGVGEAREHGLGLLLREHALELAAHLPSDVHTQGVEETHLLAVRHAALAGADGEQSGESRVAHDQRSAHAEHHRHPEEAAHAAHRKNARGVDWMLSEEDTEAVDVPRTEGRQEWTSHFNSSEGEGSESHRREQAEQNTAAYYRVGAHRARTRRA